ncbi:MAG: cytidylate kinase family protein [Deltaproteobacteria bacterium]|nr:cytidylate kinase family protein [Deltaproteobacteria bacterium]
MGVVIVSRQVGSYGDEIAALTAQKLNYELIGREKAHELADACDPDFKDACRLYEREIPKSFWERFFLNNLAYASLFESLNYDVAARGNVVILGRGAQIVLSGVPGVVKVRVVAPLDIRVDRVAKDQNMKREQAEDFVHKYGHQRRALIQQIYHRDLSDWSLYDMVLNTAAMTVEQGAELIQHAAKMMIPPPNRSEVKAFLQRQAQAKLLESAIRKEVGADAYRPIEVTSPKPSVMVITGHVGDKMVKEKVLKIARNFKGVSEVEDRLATTALTF